MSWEERESKKAMNFAGGLFTLLFLIFAVPLGVGTLLLLVLQYFTGWPPKGAGV